MTFLQEYWFEILASLFWIGITWLGMYIFYKDSKEE